MDEIKRIYFTTNDISKEIGIKKATILNWIKLFSIQESKTDSNKTKKFNADGVNKIKAIKHLKNFYGMKTDCIKQFVERNSWPSPSDMSLDRMNYMQGSQILR